MLLYEITGVVTHQPDKVFLPNLSWHRPYAAILCHTTTIKPCWALCGILWFHQCLVFSKQIKMLDFESCCLAVIVNVKEVLGCK